jgi:hypothetical protein
VKNILFREFVPGAGEAGFGGSTSAQILEQTIHGASSARLGAVSK